jgi:hypothetical protein
MISFSQEVEVDFYVIFQKLFNFKDFNWDTKGIDRQLMKRFQIFKSNIVQYITDDDLEELAIMTMIDESGLCKWWIDAYCIKYIDWSIIDWELVDEYEICSKLLKLKSSIIKIK